MTTLWCILLLQFQGISYGEHGVQVGAFSNKDNATLLAKRLNNQGFTAVMMPAADNPVKLTRVIVGPYADTVSAVSARKRLAEHDWPGMLVDYPIGTTHTDQDPINDSAGHEETSIAEVTGRDSSGNPEVLIIEDWNDTAPADNGGLIIDETSEILLTEDQPGESLSDDETLIIEDTENSTNQGMEGIDQGESDTIIIGEPPSETDEEYRSYTETSPYPGDDMSETRGTWSDKLVYRHNDFSIGLDKARLEYGNLYQSKSSVNTSNYGNLEFSSQWKQNKHWEVRLGGRIDWYDQTGTPSVDEVDLDYSDSFVRYRGENYRVTAGTQKVIWGRIDELPPTDRMSRADISRGILDPIEERRRAMPVLRFEGFQEGYKLDTVWIPDFRKAALADKDSIWYPVNKANGTILGFESTPTLKTLVRQGSISDGAPDGDGGFGVRLSNTGQQFDYAVTVQHVRQSTPYWQLDPSVRGALLSGADPDTAIASGSGATFRARYPRTWVAGGDFGFEALAATWRFEAAWISDTPVTRKDLRYDTVNSANWAAGAQFYPGDSDVRVNLQIAGINLIDAPAILDRTHIYNFNGSIFNEFGNNRWQAKTRFFIGLDQKDIYINPEISFIGWEPHELYAGWHFFNGDEETTAGYWEDNSLLTLGWRSQF